MPPHTPSRMRGTSTGRLRPDDRGGAQGLHALPVAVRDLAGRDFLERDRQVVLRGGVDHRRRELLEGALTQIVVVRVDLPGTLGGHDHARIRGVDMLEQAVYAGRNHTWI